MKPSELERRLRQAPANSPDPLAQAVHAALAGDPTQAALIRLQTRLQSKLSSEPEPEPEPEPRPATHEASVLRLLLAGLCVGAALFGTRSHWLQAPTASPAPPNTQPQTRAQPPASRASETSVEAPEPAPPPPAASKAQRAHSSRPPAPRLETRSELELLRAAHAALLRSDSYEALALTHAHLRAYPGGALAQERELLAIEALLQQEDSVGARQRAAAFMQNFPRSAHVRRLETMLERAQISPDSWEPERSANTHD